MRNTFLQKNSLENDTINSSISNLQNLFVNVWLIASSRYRDCEEIRGTGLTTPDKPVAKRSSTVPVQGRVAKKRTNEHGACLASPPIDAIAHAALCLPHPLVSQCPFPTLPSSMSLPCTPARPRAPIRVAMVRNRLPVEYCEKRGHWQITIWFQLLSV